MKYAVALSLFAAVALFSLGCGSGTTSKKAGGDTNTGHKDHDHSKDSSKTAMEKMNAELAKLSPEDAAAVRKQHFCPVSDEMLGTMGAPKKIMVKGQAVWICCDGCKKDLEQEPEKYLQKLKK